MHEYFTSSELKSSRVRTVSQHEINPNGRFVLYWMTACRRYNYNASLDHAISLSKELSKPILVVEAVSITHKFANDRILSFMIQGMMNNSRDFQENNITYIPWVEIKQKAGDKILLSLSKHASCVILDDYPTYTPNKILRAAPKILKLRVDAVDSNGILPMIWAEKEFTTAYSFRKYMQKSLVDALQTIPAMNSMDGVGDNLSLTSDDLEFLREETGLEATPLEWLWRVAEGGIVGDRAMADFPIDHSVPAVKETIGGIDEARMRLQKFLNYKLNKYSIDSLILRN